VRGRLLASQQDGVHCRGEASPTWRWKGRGRTAPFPCLLGAALAETNYLEPKWLRTFPNEFQKTPGVAMFLCCLFRLGLFLIVALGCF
jgi:hypothetical protein